MDKPRGIIDKAVVQEFGQYLAMEGDVEFDPEAGEYTMAWVELDGRPVSRFGDVDYACVRAAMLSADPDAPDMDGNFISIIDRVGRYTVLCASFGGQRMYWVVDGTGALRTTPGTPEQANADMHRLAEEEEARRAAGKGKA
jgi:hypothetical protein